MKKCIMAFLVLLLITGCSGSGNNGNIDLDQADMMIPDLHLRTKKVNAWLVEKENSNRLNISGEIEIFPSSRYELDFLRLNEIQIFQQLRLISRIIPVSRFENSEFSNKSKILIFSTIKGVIASLKLDPNKPVEMVIVFEEAGDLLIHKINDISITRVE
ncbi:MAG: hypothetical protein KKA84_11695 [Bacteroidetes bacterium]|nr:hypothetical protein [Bacteroidota bacterium]